MEVEPLPDVDVPDALLPDDAVDALVAERRPAFVPLDGPGGVKATTPPVDAATGIVQRRLSNGIRVNYRHTDNEPRAAMVRVVASGGRSREGSGAGPSGNGAVAVGTRTLSESGTVGTWDREQVELFCISRLINCVLEADEEFLCMDFHFAVGDGGIAAVLQLLHLFLEAPRWEAAAMERSKQMYLSHYRSLAKSFERASADRIMAAMMGDDRRFRDPNPEEISALSLEGMRDAVMAQLHPANIEVSVVGDLDSEELEEAVLKYLGTVAPRTDVADITDRPAQVCNPQAEARHIAWHLLDSDERACAYIAGPAPNRWGNFTKEQQVGRTGGDTRPPIALPMNPTPEQVREAAAVRRAHPLYASVTLGLLSEIVNSRLFTTVRDTLGLTYDVSFELSLFDRLAAGWYHVNVTSTHAKIKDAMMASLSVLRSVKNQPISAREVLRAKRTLITRHESDLKVS
jgi:predicted Zn-dependent peptidase